MKTSLRMTLNTVLGVVVPVIAIVVGSLASAATNPKTGAASEKSADKKTTDMNFEDVLVQGKYHFSDEAVTTVEEDKVLDSLLGVRKDFKDRIRKSVSRQ